MTLCGVPLFAVSRLSWVFLRKPVSTETATVAANDGDPDPDRWCWPAGLAMNGAALEAFAARVHRFTDRGIA
jgi:hypothetical protein